MRWGDRKPCASHTLDSALLSGVVRRTLCTRDPHTEQHSKTRSGCDLRLPSCFQAWGLGGLFALRPEHAIFRNGAGVCVRTFFGGRYLKVARRANLPRMEASNYHPWAIVCLPPWACILNKPWGPNKEVL